MGIRKKGSDQLHKLSQNSQISYTPNYLIRLIILFYLNMKLFKSFIIQKSPNLFNYKKHKRVSTAVNNGSANGCNSNLDQPNNTFICRYFLHFLFPQMFLTIVHSWNTSSAYMSVSFDILIFPLHLLIYQSICFFLGIIINILISYVNLYIYIYIYIYTYIYTYIYVYIIIYIYIYESERERVRDENIWWYVNIKFRKNIQRMYL